MRRILQFAAVTEFATGVGLVAVPAWLVPLLVRGDVNGLAALLARVLGITLVALGLACWPGRQEPEAGLGAFRGMLLYNVSVAALLGYVGAALHLDGPLLWPSVAVHAVVALLLVWSAGAARRVH